MKELDLQFLSTAVSLRALSPAEKKLARGLHLRIVEVHRGQSFANLAKRSPLPDYPEQTLRLINDQHLNEKLRTGERI